MGGSDGYVSNRWLIGVMGSVIFTLSSAWAGWTTLALIEVRDMVKVRPTHDEVNTAIDRYSPYRRDEPMIKRQLNEIDNRLERFEGKFDQLRDYLIRDREN